MLRRVKQLWRMALRMIARGPSDNLQYGGPPPPDHPNCRCYLSAEPGDDRR